MKYVLTEEIKLFGVWPKCPDKDLLDGANKVRRLRRIRAIRDIPQVGVYAGDFGGFVRCTANLSHDGTCWIHENAAVMDAAVVMGDAQIRGNAQIRDFSLIMDKAEVIDTAYVGGHQRIDGDMFLENDVSVTTKPLIFKGPVHDMIVTDKHITIGCQTRTFADWQISIDDVCSKHGYKRKFRDFYAAAINLAIDFRMN